MTEENSITNNDNEIIGNNNLNVEEEKKVLLEEQKENEVYLDTDIRVNMSTNANLGRLQKVLNDKCPACGKNLQLRVREYESVELGEPVLESESYRYCMKCDLEFEYEEKRQRRKRDRTERNVDLEDKKEGGRNANRNSQRSDSPGRNGKNHQSGFGKRKF